MGAEIVYKKKSVVQNKKMNEPCHDMRKEDSMEKNNLVQKSLTNIFATRNNYFTEDRK